MKRIITTFILLLAILNLNAQRDLKPGYIITNSNDTVYGQIDYQGDVYNSVSCYFIGENNSEPIKYNPDEIKAYRFIDDKYFVSRLVTIENKDRKVFLEFLLDGQVDLYYLPDNYYFIEKEGEKLHILENTEKVFYENNIKFSKKGHEYIGILGAYMQDCPSISKKINQSELSQSSLIKIASEYHNLMCQDKECIIFSKRPPKYVIGVSLIVGQNFNNVEMYEELFGRTRKDNARGTLYGIQLEYRNIGTFDRFFISVNGYYSSVKHSFSYPYEFYAVNNLEFESKDIHLSATFNYCYPRYKVKPFVGVGFLLYESLKSSKNLSKNISYDPRKGSFGPIILLGTKAKIANELYFKLQAEYQIFKICSSFDGRFGAKTKNFNVLTGLQYNFILK